MFAGIVVALLSNAWASAAGNGSPAPVPLEQLRGTVVTVAGDELTLRLRNGRTEIVDIAAAKAAHHTGVLPKGGAIVVYGSRDASGTFHAVSVGHASQNPLDWSPDT
ncbi:MAG TPA: hypothetical protein VKG44_04075 [Candidatus Baltobacteraceae bacterium]|nr:hypothetical protein [Candidatus Baltobacteraceae bacterium]